MMRWVLTVVTVLLLVVWPLSGRWSASVSVGGESYVFAGVDWGTFRAGLAFESTYPRHIPVHVRFIDWQGPRYYSRYRLQWLPTYLKADIPTFRGIRFAVPLWMCALASGGPTAVLWRRRRRQRRRERAGACLSCGYALRGLKCDDGGKPTCPECGT